MDSGIYKLKFPQNYFYIGKADNIPRRWEQHRNDFQKQKHTKKLQQAYDHFGMPRFTIMLRCHSDHIDLMESILIRSEWSDHCLNGVRPKEVPENEAHILVEATKYNYLNVSTAEHITQLADLIITQAKTVKEVAAVKSKNETLRKDGLILPGEFQELERLRVKTKEDTSKLERVMQRGLWARIMNHAV